MKRKGEKTINGAKDLSGITRFGKVCLFMANWWECYLACTES